MCSEKSPRPPRRSPPLPAWAAATWDVVVVGGGNAALGAALAAGDLGARC